MLFTNLSTCYQSLWDDTYHVITWLRFCTLAKLATSIAIAIKSLYAIFNDKMRLIYIENKVERKNNHIDCNYSIIMQMAWNFT